MKRESVCLTVIIGTIVSLILGLYLFILGNQATTPDAIAQKMGIKLPPYRISKADDNMDRTASSWSDYYFEIVFEEPLSEEFLQKVEKLNSCTHDGNTYKIEKESYDEWTGCVLLYPTENRATLEYTFRDALF